MSWIYFKIIQGGGRIKWNKSDKISHEYVIVYESNRHIGVHYAASLVLDMFRIFHNKKWVFF